MLLVLAKSVSLSYGNSRLSTTTYDYITESVKEVRPKFLDYYAISNQ